MAHPPTIAFALIPTCCHTSADQERLKERQRAKGNPRRGRQNQQQQQQRAHDEAAPLNDQSQEQQEGASCADAVSHPEETCAEASAPASTATAEQVAAQVAAMPPHIFTRLFPWPPCTPTTPSGLTLRLTRPPLLLAGRCVQPCWLACLVVSRATASCLLMLTCLFPANLLALSGGADQGVKKVKPVCNATRKQA